MDLDTRLKGVLGGRTASALAKSLDLHTVGDLLGYYPRRYEERGRLTNLAGLILHEHITVFAQVQRVSTRQVGQRKSLLEVFITDGQRDLRLVWFNQAWRQRDLRVGRQAFFSGRVRRFRERWELANPEYELVDVDADADANAGVEDGPVTPDLLVPIYPATADVSTWTLRRSMRTVLDVLGEAPDPLPASLREGRGLPDLAAALRGIHRPGSWAEMIAARERLAFDEALLLQVALAQRRRAAALVPTTPRPSREDGLRAAFDARLPFVLTAGQLKVGDTLAGELSGAVPMHRLLQGEVGSGKTVVALRAMLQVVDTGGQAALLAPTEVLASQHLRSLRELLGPLGRAGELDGADEATRVVLLSGSQGAPARRAALAAASDGSAGIVVGTHALLQERVVFADLGLIVVDEQHRFGVEQREALRAKGGAGGSEPPHVLVMTATPIPRTVAMTVFGDLSISTLAELPAGRSPVTTHVVPAGNDRWMARSWGLVREQAAAGHQTYVVCPRIGDGGSDDDDEEPPDEAGRRPPLAVLDVAATLAGGPLAGVAVGILHGRLAVEEKDEVMRRFAAGETPVLVATTVVEVGVDVPTATVMVVLDAERFGVSQLHQLRGRVGRGGADATCLLVTEAAQGPALERLQAVASTTDGFALSRIDLEHRREGDVLGATQSGRRSQLKVLRLLRDEPVIAAARREATALVAADPELRGHPVLAAALAQVLDAEQAEYLERA